MEDCNQRQKLSEIKPPLKKHEVKCELYQRLAVNEKQCRICKKIFSIKGSLNQHIGQNHKKELLELKTSEVKLTSNERLAENKKRCRICKQSFSTKESLNQHIVQNHKKKLLKLQKSEVKLTSNESESEGIKTMDTTKNDIEKLKENQNKHNKQQLNWLALGKNLL